MHPFITWGQWLTSPGFGGAAAVLAAALAFSGVARASAVQRENARREHWWDRLKWAVELLRSAEPIDVEVGIEALTAITEADGFDTDEMNFLSHITRHLLPRPSSGTLETPPDEEERDVCERA